jgi:hypothetical protein
LLGATGSGKKTSSGKFSTNPKRPAERRRRLLVASWVVERHHSRRRRREEGLWRPDLVGFLRSYDEFSFMRS